MSPANIVEVNDWAKPLPSPDNVSKTFWSAASRGELVIQECTRCGARQFYGREMCTSCAGVPKWIVTAGEGTVYTFTVIRQYGLAPFAAELPYVVAMIELPEGPMILGGITDCPVDAVHVGLKVEVHFYKVEDEIGIPYWRPAERL
jgi:uncharacterized OB-fold protein